MRSKFDSNVTAWIEIKLKLQWSPEQIAGRLLIEQGIKISHEWIYRWILKEREAGGILFRNLRRSHRKNRKRYGIPRIGGKYAQSRSIEIRPEIVSNRGRIGDWEGDSVIGAKHKGGIISLVERVTMLARLQKVTTHQAIDARRAIIEMMNATVGPKHTMTFDRGSEFAEYEMIEKSTGLEIYFAHPYSSYERGTNENLNGLIRQYLPKKTDLTKIPQEVIYQIEWLLNHRPRKKLDYFTPFESFFGYCPYPQNRDKFESLAA